MGGMGEGGERVDGAGREDLRSNDRAGVGPGGVGDRSELSRSARGVGSEVTGEVCWSRLSVCSMRLIPVFMRNLA